MSKKKSYTNQTFRHLSLRHFNEQDLSFLKKLYATIRQVEFSQVDWSENQKAQFFEQQFLAQHSHYTQHYCTDDFMIIELKKQPIGRLYLDHWEKETRIVDIALLPEYCGHGIGSYYLKKVIELAKDRNVPVTIHVERHNPAKALYERIGFRPKTETHKIYILMEWHPYQQE